MPTVFRANLGFQTDLNFAHDGFFSGWRVNLDYIYSHYRNPFTIVDLSQTPRSRRASASTASRSTAARSIARSTRPCAGCDAPARYQSAHRRSGRERHSAPASPPTPRRRADADQLGRLQQPHRVVHPVEELRRAASSPPAARLLHARLCLHRLAGPAEHVQLDGRARTTTRPPRSTARIRRRRAASSKAATTSPVDARSARSSSSDLATHVRLHLRRPLGPSVQPDLHRQRRVQRQRLGQRQRADLPPDRHRRSEHFADVEHGGGPAACRLRQRTSTARRTISAESIKRNTCNNDWYYDLDLRFSQELPGLSRLIGVGGVATRSPSMRCSTTS